MENRGSEFGFSLKVPYREDTVKVVNEKEEQFTFPAFKYLDLLAIDDDPQILNLYRYLLETRANKLIVLQDPIDLDRYKEDTDKFDLIISDYRLARGRLKDFYKNLASAENNSTPLLVVSAAKVDPENFRDTFNVAEYMAKPFKSKELLKTIYSIYCKAKFGYPEIESILKDYDHQKELYEKALDILVTELSAMGKSLEQAIKNNDVEIINEVRHKMVTTLRRLRTDAFETWMNTIEDKLKTGPPDKVIAELRTAVGYLISCIREQKSLS